MMYLLAIFVPPLAVLLSGKPFQAFVNFFLTLMLWFPGMIHAFFVVNSKKADKRADKICQAIENSRVKA